MSIKQGMLKNNRNSLDNAHDVSNAQDALSCENYYKYQPFDLLFKLTQISFSKHALCECRVFVGTYKKGALNNRQDKDNSSLTANRNIGSIYLMVVGFNRLDEGHLSHWRCYYLLFQSLELLAFALFSNKTIKVEDSICNCWSFRLG